MKMRYLLTPLAFGIMLNVSCERIADSAPTPSSHLIRDGELLEAQEAWKSGDLRLVSDLLTRLGDPVDKTVKNGMTTYSWRGAEEFWLFAGIDTATSTVTGISVGSRY